MCAENFQNIFNSENLHAMPESTENIRDGNHVHGIIKTISDKVASCGVCLQPCKGRPSNLRNTSRSKRSNNKPRREDIYHYDIDDISTGPQNTTGGGEYSEESTFLINSYLKDGNDVVNSRSIDDESSTNTQQILTLMPYFWKSHPNSAKKLEEARIKQDLARRKKAVGKSNNINEIDRDLSSRPSSPLGYENQFGVVFEKMKTESVVVPLYDRDRVNLSHDEYGMQPCDKISYIVKETNDMIADNDNNDPNKEVRNVDEINRESTKNEAEVSDDEGKKKVYNDDLEKIMKKLQVIDSTFHPSTPKKDLNDNNNDTPTTTASTYDDTALLYSMSSSRLTDEMEEPMMAEASVTDQVPFDEMNIERNVHKTTDKKRFSLASLRRKRRSKDKKRSSLSSKSKKKSSKKHDGTKAKKSNDLDPPIIAVPPQNDESIYFEQDGNRQIDEPIESPSKISSVPPKTANTSSVQNTIVYDNSVESNSDQWFAFEDQLD